MGKLTCLRQGPGALPHVHRGLQAGLGGSLCSCQERSDLSVTRGIDFSWAHQLPGKLVEEQAPHLAFDENNHQLGPEANTKDQLYAQDRGKAGTASAGGCPS